MCAIWAKIYSLFHVPCMTMIVESSFNNLCRFRMIVEMSYVHLNHWTATSRIRTSTHSTLNFHLAFVCALSVVVLVTSILNILHCHFEWDFEWIKSKKQIFCATHFAHANNIEWYGRTHELKTASKTRNQIIHKFVKSNFGLKRIVEMFKTNGNFQAEMFT